MNACLLALWGDSLTYTVASALAAAGHGCVVWIADVARDRESKWSLSPRIARIPGVQVVADEHAEAPERLDHLIVQGHPLMPRHRDVLNRLAARAPRLTAISAGDRSRGYRQALQLQWTERRWYGPWFRKIGRVAYKDGFYPLDVFALLRSRRVVGFDAHSKFLGDPALYQTIHAQDWQVEAKRPIRANFLGSRDPDTRGRILDSVEAYFVGEPGRALAQPDKRMVWHVYSDAQPAALSPEQFVGVLSESDFTLAPLGFSLVTHRPVEALLRGSIPVLNANELDLYDLGLAHGVNCIAVPPGGWPAAMESICRMGEAQVVAMRRNIRAMFDDRVAYPALARDICARLGLGNEIDGAPS
jgi:hypothetical protein